MLVVFKAEEVERLFKETVYNGDRVIYKTHIQEQTHSVQDVVIMDLNQ